MRQSGQIVNTSFIQALQELRANRLRTFLSLLGITIGIFCIVTVWTMLDGMESGIRKDVATLGSDVLYVTRFSWTGDGGDFKWWEYIRRKPMSDAELNAVLQRVPGVKYAALSYNKHDSRIKYGSAEVEGIEAWGVTPSFEQIQDVEILSGRYLSPSELGGGSFSVVLGNTVYTQLFPPDADPVGKKVRLFGRDFTVVGLMKKLGQNAAGFNFDNSIIYPYSAARILLDMNDMQFNLNNDPAILVKGSGALPMSELKEEVTGVLRGARRVRPGDKENFAINDLNQIAKTMDQIFGTIDVIGSVIGGFSLLVGAFGIANIMFVTVKERTKIIGLKKAIGAPRAVILTEFLIEAITLCLIGGLVGILLVVVLCVVLTHAAQFEVSLSAVNFLKGILISMVVGTIAGIIPAFRASRMDPVVAIRSM